MKYGFCRCVLFHPAGIPLKWKRRSRMFKQRSASCQLTFVPDGASCPDTTHMIYWLLFEDLKATKLRQWIDSKEFYLPGQKGHGRTENLKWINSWRTKVSRQCWLRCKILHLELQIIDSVSFQGCCVGIFGRIFDFLVSSIKNSQISYFGAPYFSFNLLLCVNRP